MMRIDDIPDPVECRINSFGIERFHKQLIDFRHGVFQILQLIQRVAVSSGCFFVQSAIAFIHFLYDTGLEFIPGGGLIRMGLGKPDIHPVSPNLVFPSPVAGFDEAADKRGTHFRIGETDRSVHSQRPQLRKCSQFKGCQPPVRGLPSQQDPPFPAQDEGERQKFAVLDVFIKSTPETVGVQVLKSGIVYSDFCACGDTILAFPQLYQPSLSAVRKCDRFCIENHIKKGRAFII